MGVECIPAFLPVLEFGSVVAMMGSFEETSEEFKDVRSVIEKSVNNGDKDDCIEESTISTTVFFVHTQILYTIPYVMKP